MSLSPMPNKAISQKCHRDEIMNDAGEKPNLHKDVFILHNDGANVNITEVRVNNNLSGIRLLHCVITVLAFRSQNTHTAAAHY